MQNIFKIDSDTILCYDDKRKENIEEINWHRLNRMWKRPAEVQERDEAHKGSFTPTSGDITFAKVKKEKSKTVIKVANSPEHDIEVQN